MTKFTFYVCGMLATVVVGGVWSQAVIDAWIARETPLEIARLQKLGYDCSSCKVRGAPGPEMGALGVPLILAGYGLYSWYRRKR